MMVGLGRFFLGDVVVCHGYIIQNSFNLITLITAKSLGDVLGAKPPAKSFPRDVEFYENYGQSLSFSR